MSSRSMGVTKVRLRRLNDLVRNRVTLVPISPIFGFRPDRLVGREHFLEGSCSAHQLVGQRLEIAQNFSSRGIRRNANGNPPLTKRPHIPVVRRDEL